MSLYSKTRLVPQARRSLSYSRPSLLRSSSSRSALLLAQTHTHASPLLLLLLGRWRSVVGCCSAGWWCSCVPNAISSLLSLSISLWSRDLFVIQPTRHTAIYLSSSAPVFVHPHRASVPSLLLRVFVSHTRSGRGFVWWWWWWFARVQLVASSARPSNDIALAYGYCW